MIKRRTFLKLGSTICLAGAFSFSSMLGAHDKTDAAKQITRLTAEQLTKLGITFPSKNISIPTGGSIDLAMKPDVIRQYGSAIYTHYELFDHIVIYDLNGLQQGLVPLPARFSSIKDFAIDEELELVYLLPLGADAIEVVDFNGDFIHRIGEFGVDLPEQLNGSLSITLDKNKRLHVLCAGDNTIKTFADSGAFLGSQSSVFGRKNLKAKSIDGTVSVIAVGGTEKNRLWQRDLRGQLID